MKNRFLFIFFIILVGCTYPTTTTNVTNVINEIVYKDAEEESTAFISEALPVYNGKDNTRDPSGSMFVRFYDDGKYIPYVAVQYYLEKFSDLPITKTSYSEHKYKYYGAKNKGKCFNIIVDAEKDTIYSPDWDFFLSFSTEENKNSDGEVNKIFGIMISTIDFFQGQQAITFDLNKYGFKIYGGTDDAYVPLCIMNHLFSCLEYANYVFNGEAVYYADFHCVYFYDSFQKSPWYTDENGNVKNRPQELIGTSYNLLCFTHDYLYEKPGYYGFADTQKTCYADAEIVKKADVMSLDEILNTYAPDTKQLLHSSSYKEYIMGINSLFYYVYGDSHSSILIYDNYMILDKEARNETVKKIKLSPKVTKHENIDVSMPISTVRENSGKSEGLELLSDKKTAVIRFDAFYPYLDEWEIYYASSPEPEPNPELVTIPDDTYGLAYKSFYTLLNDDTYKDVKNVIIDLSCNGGGVLFTIDYFLSAMIGSFNLYENIVNTNARLIINYYGTDLNLDDEIDEEDQKYGKKIRDRFNFAVLTSYYTFSAGNSFTCVCAEAGIPIIGERSGGGSCGVLLAATADGLPYRYSSLDRFTFADGTSFENGAPITVEMPYVDFYDDAKLIAVMKDLYGE